MNKNNHARSKQNRLRKAKKRNDIIQLKHKANDGNEKAKDALEKLTELQLHITAYASYRAAGRTMPRVRNQRQKRKVVRIWVGYRRSPDCSNDGADKKIFSAA